MGTKISTLHKYTMVTTICRELVHVSEDADSLLSWVTDGEDDLSIDYENAQLISSTCKDLLVTIKKWKESLIDRL